MTLHVAYRVFYEKRASARSLFEGGQWATGTACLLPYSFLLAPNSFFPFSFSCSSLCKFSPSRGDKNSLFNLQLEEISYKWFAVHEVVKRTHLFNYIGQFGKQAAHIYTFLGSA
jgi:hypothetical protein